MPPIRTILYTTDFSPLSEHARQIACALARDYGARLLVLHVVTPRVATLGGGTESTRPGAYQEHIGELVRRLDAEGFPPGMETQVSAGDPATEILRLARDSKCDLIVMGTHGRTGLGRLLLGSVAEEVIRKATCPVLVVKVPIPDTQSTAEAKPAEAARGAEPGLR
jgi:nucleotide-binding universal stress UspA family protein